MAGVSPQRRRAHLGAIALLLAASLAVVEPLAAASPADLLTESSSPVAAPSPAALQEQIGRKKDALRAEFDILRRKLEAAAQATSYVDREALLEEVGVLQQLQRSFEQQAAIAQLMGETETARAQLEEELRRERAAGAGSGDRPVSFLAFDRLQDELDAQSGRLATLDAAVEFGGRSAEQGRAAVDAAERARRAAQEALDLNRDDSRSAALASQLHLAKLRSQAAAEELRLHEIELASEELERAAQRVRVDLLREQVERAERDARLTDQDLAAQTLKLQEEEFQTTQALVKLRQEMMSGGSLAAGAAQGELQRWQRQTRQLRVNVLNQRLQQLTELRQLWSRRYALARSDVPRAELDVWDADSRRAIERAANEERLYLARLAELRRPTQEATEGGVAPTPSPDEEREVEDRGRAFEQALANVSSFRRANERLLRQIEVVTQSEPWTERFAHAQSMLTSIWRYELLAVQDRPITVGKVVLGLLLFLAGLWVAAFVSRFLGRRLWPRLGLDAGASAALQSLSYYFLVALLTLLSLEVVNVPLTIFTFVGGALAIGVGFGSQNLMNNFISGLILLAERPIKVGDLIEIGELGGTVERIGARSTRVRSHRNIHVIIPNSHFLEKEVVNWTLADDSVKTAVQVSVCFGGPVERVRDILTAAVGDHPKIFTTPAPTVLLKNFGAETLDFEVHFWLRTRSTMERWIVESDVRFRVEQLFRESGIEFPRSDVHLQTAKPLEVHVRRE